MLRSVITLVLAVPAASLRVALEADVTPLSARAGWSKGERASPNDSIELTFLLRQQNVEQLEKHLFAASDPASPMYGRHLSNEEVHKRIIIRHMVLIKQLIIVFFQKPLLDQFHWNGSRNVRALGISLE